jgi:hypothetical protein
VKILELPYFEVQKSDPVSLPVRHLAVNNSSVFKTLLTAKSPFIILEVSSINKMTGCRLEDRFGSQQ